MNLNVLDEGVGDVELVPIKKFIGVAHSYDDDILSAVQRFDVCALNRNVVDTERTGVDEFCNHFGARGVTVSWSDNDSRTRSAGSHRRNILKKNVLNFNLVEIRELVCECDKLNFCREVCVFDSYMFAENIVDEEGR